MLGGFIRRFEWGLESGDGIVEDGGDLKGGCLVYLELVLHDEVVILPFCLLTRFG